MQMSGTDLGHEPIGAGALFVLEDDVGVVVGHQLLEAASVLFGVVVVVVVVVVVEVVVVVVVVVVVAGDFAFGEP